MELYRHELGTVFVLLPLGSTNVSCVILKDGVQLAGPLSPVVTTETENVKASLQLPFNYVINDDELDVKFTFNINYSTAFVVEHVSIVTPIISKSAADTISAGKYRENEPIVRHIIQYYTGQRFGIWNATYTVYGESGQQLLLPDRLISQTGIAYDGITYDAESFIIKGDGWYLGRKINALLTIKEAPPDDALISFPGIIYAPGYNRTIFHENTTYAIEGIWGYEYVPHEVQEAAKLLFNDYTCKDSVYRDRYLKSVRSADWRIEFNSGAWQGTGNVRADQLLSKYRRSGMVVI